MARKAKNNFDTMDTPYEVQPPNGSAEPDIEYGGVARVADEEPRDPMGVMPDDAPARNIGPGGGTGQGGR
jgi:hypothetical protein